MAEQAENQQTKNSKTFALCTLGCKVNQEEGVALAAVFQENGWQQMAFEEVARVYIINTCTVTHLADKKSRQLIRRAIRKNPQAVVVATGCYAQTGQEELAEIAGIDLIVGTNDRPQLFALVQMALATKNQTAPQQPKVVVSDLAAIQEFTQIGNLTNSTSRARAFLKIQDGCSQFCTYCIIPYARGPVRSKPAHLAVAEAAQLITHGYQELVLTGIHIGAYGTDLQPALSLTDLIEQMVGLKNLNRLRLGSIEPLEVTDELLTLMAENPQICPHLHIPLQACSDALLEKMNRHYTVRFYESLLKRIRQILPNVAITTDLIVGFPGETPEIFAASLAKIKELAFDAIHIFPYSARRGTPAATFANQVAVAEKQNRVQQLTAAAAGSKLAYWRRQLGSQTRLLLEQTQQVEGRQALIGHSPSYLPLAIDQAGQEAVCKTFRKGTEISVEIIELGAEYLWCKLL